MATDQLTTEIVAHRLLAATDEMMATLVKTAFSPNVKERRDCSDPSELVSLYGG